jgi:hypothetical protein
MIGVVGLEPTALGVIVVLKPLLEDSINPMLPRYAGKLASDSEAIQI